MVISTIDRVVRKLDRKGTGAHFGNDMTKLPPARAETTEAFLMQSGPELAALCTECGACFNACPMVDYVNLRGADPKIVTRGFPGRFESVGFPRG